MPLITPDRRSCRYHPAACGSWTTTTAAGTAEEPGFDDEDVAACLTECRRRMPAERGPESPFADAVLHVGGPLIDQLAAISDATEVVRRPGRHSGWKPDSFGNG